MAAMSGSAGFSAETKIKLMVENPKKVGSESHARYEKYKGAKTVEEFFALGGLPVDLRHDFQKGFLT